MSSFNNNLIKHSDLNLALEEIEEQGFKDMILEFLDGRELPYDYQLINNFVKKQVQTN